MKRPLLKVALLFGGGLILADWFPLPLSWLFSISIGFLALALFWPTARPALLPPLIVFAGWVNLTSRTAVVSPHDLRTRLADSAQLVTVRGTLAKAPQYRAAEIGDTATWRSIAVIDVDSMSRRGGEQPVRGRIAASTPGLLPPEAAGGCPVIVTGVIKPPPGPKAERLFDYRAHLARQGVYYTLNVQSTNDWQFCLPPGATRVSLPDQFRSWAQANLARGHPPGDEAVSLLWAMTLGWKTGLNDEVAEPFMRSGTLHIFAISGLHIALIAGIWVGLLRVVRVPRSVCGLVVIPVLWFYATATGYQPSAVRASIMMTIVIAGWSLNRPVDLLNSLAAAALVILAWDPRQLFQASFQLSFFVVLSIALVLPPLERRRERWLQPDPLQVPELRPAWQRLLDPPVRFLCGSLAVSLAAWLGSLPLTAHYFHLFTPVSLLANVPIVLMAACATMSSMGSILTGAWFPACSDLFNNSAWFWMKGMIGLSQWAATLPGAFQYVPPPSPLLIALYYALLVSLSAGWWLIPKVRWPLAAVVGLITLFLGWQWLGERRAAVLHILPTNGGHACFLDSAGLDGKWLIDPGDSNAVERLTVPFLRAHGVNRVPRLLLTHGDMRHVGGTELLRTLMPVDRIHTSGIRFRSTTYRAIIGGLENAPEAWEQVHCGDQAGPWTILHPESHDRFTQADDSSLVLRGEFGGMRVLLLGDLGWPGQQALTSRHTDLRSDIVVVGLPTRGEPLEAGFLEAISPKLIVIADSEYPATARAGQKLRDRLAQSGIPVLYTGETGALTVSLRTGGWRVKSAEARQLEIPARVAKAVPLEQADADPD